MKSSASFQQRSQRQRAHRCPETNWIPSGGHTPRARIQLVSALHQPTVTVCQSTQQLAGLLDRGVLGSQLLQPKQGVVQGAGEEGQRAEEGTHSSQQVVGQQFRWATHNRDRGEQKYDHTLHQPPLQCRDNTAPQSSRAAAASSSNLLAWDRLQQLCPPKDAGWARQDLPGVLMTNRAKLPLVSCQHRCAGVMGPLHPHGQRGLQDRGEVSP